MLHKHARMFIVFLLFAVQLSFLYAADPIMRVTFLNVDQGDCIIIRTAEKTIMIDAGDDTKNAAQAFIIPYLRREGINRINTAYISHPHRDHFAGFTDLMDAVKIDKFIYSIDARSLRELPDTEESNVSSSVYKTFLLKAAEKKIPLEQAVLDQKQDWGKGIDVKIVHTNNKDIDFKNFNNDSLVIKATVGKISYLFTGDAEREAEAEMINKYGKLLSATVLKAGHHGSRTSSSHAFLDMVKPSYAVISAGKNNQFSHPHPETLEKYEYLHVGVYRTDIEGDIVSHTDGKTVTFVTTSTPLEFVKSPQLISLTQNSATLQWETNREGTTAIYYGEADLNRSSEIDSFVRVHTATLTGLKPFTTYKFVAITRDPRDPSQEIAFEGTVTTKPGSSVPLPTIKSIKASYPQLYVKYPFRMIIPVYNPPGKQTENINLTLYHSAMTDTNILGKVNFNPLNPGATIEAIIKTEISWIGNVQFIAVLRNGKTIIDTAAISLPINAKQIFVDAAHGNKDYFTGQFAGMKMDLNKESGFEMKSISRSITYDLIKDSFVVLLPHPKTEYQATELQALKEYTAKGGSIMLFGQADYNDYSKPDYLNAILESVGSKIRFNDDQVCHPKDNIGPPWKFFVKNFPNPQISGSDVTNLLFRNSASLIGTSNKPLKETISLKVLANLDEEGYNQNADNLDDGYIFAKGTKIPVAVSEDLGLGRIVCIGERDLYADTFYSNPSNLSTREFNRNLISWLSESRFKTIKEIISYVHMLDSEPDFSIKYDRFEQLSEKFVSDAQTKINEDEAYFRHLEEALSSYSGEGITQLKNKLNELNRFRTLHREAGY